MSAAETLASEVGVLAACEALNVSRATLYRHRRTRAPRARPHPSRSLNPLERQAVLETLNADAYADLAPAQVHAKLLDAGIYLASPRTMYRILANEDQVRERRNLRRHPHHVKPELVATAPNQVWSWDITKLLTVARGSYLFLYVIVDIFSRYIVGWLLAEHENARLAQRLIDESCAKQGIKPGRPRVSNDNPYSEAQFKTLKYRPEFPRRFESFLHAKAVCEALLTWYNTQHQHSGIAFLTPGDVHHGRATEILAQRQSVLDEAYARNPERFPRPPRVTTLPAAVRINPPGTELVVNPHAH